MTTPIAKVCYICDRKPRECRCGESIIVRAVCDCGTYATRYCSDAIDTLVPCKRPICDSNGEAFCAAHRHRNGTMGNPEYLPRETTWEGHAPDGPGVWEAIKAKFVELFWSADSIANLVWRDISKQFPPPSPLPEVTVNIGKNKYLILPKGPKRIL